MNTYPYSGRDLYEEPESYSYAACDNPDYLAQWRESRQAAIVALSMESNGASPTIVNGGEHGEVTGFSLERLLETYHRSLLEHEGSAESIAESLHRYVIKYEVFKRLHSHYNASIRKTPEAKPASLRTYILFAACLAKLCELGFSLNYLSTLLKVCDALASKGPHDYSSSEKALLVDTLRKENELIRALEEDVCGN